MRGRLRMNILKREYFRVVINMFRGNFLPPDFAKNAIVAHRGVVTHLSVSLPGAATACASSSLITNVWSPVSLLNLFPSFCADASFGSLPKQTPKKIHSQRHPRALVSQE